jgi:hypothetical protein
MALQAWGLQEQWDLQGQRATWSTLWEDKKTNFRLMAQEKAMVAVVAVAEKAMVATVVVDVDVIRWTQKP